MIKPRFQTQKDKAWADEQDVMMPTKRLTKGELLAEKTAAKLYKRAIEINELLKRFKDEMSDECRAVMSQVYEDNGQDPSKSKGNFTWYNYDRSMKICVKINERTEFDETLIELSKNKLNEFLEKNVETTDTFIKQFVIDAFSQSRGTLDAKKVMSLLKYRSKVKSPLFQEALDLLEQSIRHPDSKRYFQLYVRNQDGEYENIDLNFSNI